MIRIRSVARDKANSRRISGFALPTVLIASIIMLAVLLASVASTVAIRSSLVSQYYNQIATNAGDAGAVYAKACLAANNGAPQWGYGNPVTDDYKAGGPLHPDTDCTGLRLPIITCPATATDSCHFVAINGKIVSKFTVPLPALSGGKATNVSSVGSVYLYRTSDATLSNPWRTYSHTSTLVTGVSSASVGVQVLVVGAGGGGGRYGGGAGAGGYRYVASMAIVSPEYPVVVGTGGAGWVGDAQSGGNAASGLASSFNGVSSAGGGGAGNYGNVTGGSVGSTGGSGGGSGNRNTVEGTSNQSATGNTPSTSPSQGNSGGSAGGASYNSISGGGGGGAGATGATGAAGGAGGVGVVNPIAGSTIGQNVSGTYYLAGGGSGGQVTTKLAGGNGGGGYGQIAGTTTADVDGVAGTGGGGGGARDGIINSVQRAGNGGSGVVIISYPTGSMNALGGTITTSGGNTIHTFTSSGTFTIIPAGSALVYAWGGGGAGGTIGGWTYGSYGGAGGAVQGLITPANGSYPVVVGGAGIVNSYSSDFKCAIGGGGCASNNNSDNRYSGGGGGYSGIFTSSISQANALLIAAAGGGGSSVWNGNGTTSSASGGAGGGTNGQMGYGDMDDSYKGKPGTQLAAGATVSGTYLSISGTGGANIQGALQGGTTISQSYGGGGGGGYWGGSAGGYFSNGPYPINQMTGGGGGSGYYKPTTVSSGVLTAGYGTTPGDLGNPFRGSAGNAGGYQGNGSNGAVVIAYPTGTVTATGGLVTTSGGNTIHTFNASSNFIVGAAQRASCAAIKTANESTGDGIYWVYPNGSTGIQVYCDMTNDGGGWTLVLQNNSGVTTPSPTWTDAISNISVNGTFGSTLTSFDILVGLSNWNYFGTHLRAEVGTSPSSISHKTTYGTFSLNSGNNYALSLSTETKVTGATSPGLFTYSAANTFQFTTSDADHDTYGANCAASYNNHPWWYGSCWDGNFFAGGATYQEAPYWTGSTTDYYAYGSIWIK